MEAAEPEEAVEMRKTLEREARSPRFTMIYLRFMLFSDDFGAS